MSNSTEISCRMEIVELRLVERKSSIIIKNSNYVATRVKTGVRGSRKSSHSKKLHEVYNKVLW